MPYKPEAGEGDQGWSFRNITKHKGVGRSAMGSMMSKQEAKRLVDMMPDNATWDDLIHEVYVREVIERGLDDSKAGRTTDVREVRAKYGLPE